MYKILRYVSLLLFGVVTSCGNDDAITAGDEPVKTDNSSVVAKEEADQVEFSFADIILKDEMSSRASFSVVSEDNVEKIKFYMSKSDNDALGIYPVNNATKQQDGTQVEFLIQEDNATEFSFKGGGWGLLTTHTYVSYYPYSHENTDASKIFIDYQGQKQTGNNNLTNASKYAFYASGLTSAENNALNFRLEHTGYIFRFQLKLPDGVNKSFKKLVLYKEGDDLVFADQNTIDLTDGNCTYTPVSKSNALTLELENVATTDQLRMLTLYMIIAPTDLTDKTFNIYLEDEDGNIYQSKNIAGNKYYKTTTTVYCTNFYREMEKLDGKTFVIKTWKDANYFYNGDVIVK